MCCKSKPTGFVLVLCLVACFAGPNMAVAEEEKPTTLSKKTTTAPTKSTAKPGSLASAAANIKLKTTDDSGKKITISDHNLGELSKGGVVSTGGGVTGVPEPAALNTKTATPTTSPSTQQEIEQQRLKVDALDRSLKDWEKQVAKNDPLFANTTQHRSPGVRAPNDLTREAVTAELEAERKKLASMEKQAAKDGVKLDSPKK